MTAYVLSTVDAVSVTAGSSATSRVYALAPSSFEIRIAQIYYALGGVGATNTQFTPRLGFAPTVSRYSSGSASGGTSATPIALRQGAAAAATTARWGTGVSVSGTQTSVYYPIAITGTNSAPAAKAYTFPSDFVVSPGAVVAFATGGIGAGGSSGATISADLQVMIYFEELRLAWHT